MRELLRRVTYLWNRRRMESELAEELASHRESMPPDRRRDFGNDLRLLEDTREVWGWTWLDRLRQDVLYGGRVLRNSPWFTLTAVLVLSLGIGVPLTALRTVLQDLEGGSLPNPDTLVRLTRRAPGLHITSFSWPELMYYSANARSFRNVIGVSGHNRAAFGTGDDTAPESISLTFTTSGYFPEFGIKPVMGRLLTAVDERADAEPAALVGEDFWRRRFGAVPGVVGETIRINGKALRVVGIVPESSRVRGDVWMPLIREPYVIEGSTLLTEWRPALDLYARLKPGVSPKASEQETLALSARFREIWPDHVSKGEYLDAHPILQLDGDSQEFKIVVTAAAMVLLLLIAACANLGTLVLARGVNREREIRTRLALGASRARVIRQLFTESVLLASLSGACGLLFSSAALKAIQLRHNSAMGIVPDWRSFAATSGIALLAALIFGLPPALRLTGPAPREGRARTIFLGVQVAVSCLLLIVSTLLASGRHRLGGTDPGFDYRQLVSLSPGLKAHGYNGPAARTYLDNLRARVRQLPGVQEVSEVWLEPWGNVHMGSAWAGRQFSANRVDPRFLKTMGIRLARGRRFQTGEQDVTIVTESMARILWPGEEALGKRLPWDFRGPTVIGVARNASTTTIGDPEPREYYLPQSESPAPESMLLVRVAGRPHDSVRTLQDLARSLDLRLQPAVETLTDVYDAQMDLLARPLFAIALLGGVAILLSAIGLSGLAGYAVAQRTRELGLRIALGARPIQIARAILAPMSRPIAIGFLCGALGATGVVRILRSGIPAMAGVRLFDPFAQIIAVAFFAGVVALSVLGPGLRAIAINPCEALRHE